MDVATRDPPPDGLPTAVTTPPTTTTAPDTTTTATVANWPSSSLASLTDRSYRFTGTLDELDAPTRYALT